MASINYSALVILFFLVFQYSSASNINDYEKWLSWNKDHYLTMKANETFTESAIVKKVLDDRLMFAEANKLIIRVNQMGTGDFKTIKEALATVPLHNDKRIEINIGPGVYKEKIHIPSTMGFITFLGDASNPPTITGSDWSGVNPGGTFETATVGVDGDYFFASNIKFENTHPHETGSDKDQAVALRISGTKAAFFNCGFYGSQDTLYDHKGLHYFSNCFIQGSVDFIFGDGRSFYENCELKSIAKTSGAVTAQQRESPSMDSGFSFKNCRITGSGQIYLGRAWGAYSRVVFSYTAMENIILPEGWNDWGVPNRDLTVYYGEYNCDGVGANMSGRVKWARRLTDQEAQPFLGTYFVDGDTWITKPKRTN